jgi:hypothetical protein
MAHDPTTSLPDRRSPLRRMVLWFRDRLRRRRAVADNWFDDIEPDDLAG